AGSPRARPRRSAGAATDLRHADPARRSPVQGKAGRQVQRSTADRRDTPSLGRGTDCRPARRAEQALPEMSLPGRLPPEGGSGGQPEPAGSDDAEAAAEVPRQGYLYGPATVARLPAKAEQEEVQAAGAAQSGAASPGNQDGEGPRRAPTRS